MPIYEFECPSCGRIFEEWVRLSDAHGEEACPSCGTPSPRIMSHTSFVLKGQGWYVTEYGYKKDVKGDGEKSQNNGKTDTQAKTADGTGKEQSADTGKDLRKTSDGASQPEKSVSAEKPANASKDTAAPQSGGGSTKESA